MLSAFGMFWLWVIPFLILATLVGWSVWTVIRAVTRPRRSSPVPACEGCRYPVAGLTSFACPECGRDLRVTGIITRAMEVRRRGSVLGAVFAWTCLSLVIAYFSMLGYVTQSMLASTGMGATPVTSHALTPASAAYQKITLCEDAVTPGVLEATLLRNDGSQRVLVVNCGAQSWTSKSQDGQTLSQGTWDATTCTKWFVECGLPVSDATVSDEAIDLKMAIDLIGNGASPRGMPFRRMTITGPIMTRVAGSVSPGVGPTFVQRWIPLMVPLVVWVAGVVFIVWRRRTLLRHAEAMEPQVVVGSPTSAAD